MEKYPHKESSILEFKREIPNKKQVMLKTVVAFANTYGGEIIVGVDDDGYIIGVPEETVECVMDDISRSIYDTVSPGIFPSIYTKRFGDKLVVVDIAEGPSKPYHFASKRISDGTYIRFGSHTMPATPDIIHQLQWQGQRKYLDEMPVYSAQESDIDAQAFEDFLSKRKQGYVKVDVEEMLFHYNILTKDRGRVYPTVGGMLLFGQTPEKFFPETFTICTHIQGTQGREVLATRDCIGSIYQQYRDTIAFVTSRLNTAFTIKGTGPRQETLEIPPEAIREVVLNAIVHRNYLISGPTKITIYDDRVEVFSPGNFPGPIMADQVDIGVTYIRNTVIIRVFRDLGIIEKLGSGFMTLFSSYASYKLPTPIVSEGVGFVKCILPRPVQGVDMNKDEHLAQIFQLFLSQRAIQTSDVMQHLEVSRATAVRILAKYTELGYLKKQGKGAATSYVKA